MTSTGSKYVTNLGAKDYDYGFFTYIDIPADNGDYFLITVKNPPSLWISVHLVDQNLSLDKTTFNKSFLSQDIVIRTNQVSL